MCNAQPVSPASSSAILISASSTSTGRDASQAFASVLPLAFCSAVSFGESALDAKIRGVEHRRLGVERHVEETGAAARRERRRTGCQTFPVLTAGLVEMHVRVDDPGENVATGRIKLAVGGIRNLRRDL